MNEYTWLLPIVFMVIGGVVCTIFGRLNKGNPAAEKPKEPELTERFDMSIYRGGLSNAATPASLASCRVTEASFIFVRGRKGDEIGRIPRDSIENIIVGEKSRIAEQLTAQEKLYLGKISTSAKDKSYCLVLSWENSSKTKHNSIFEFTKQSSAENAAQELKKWMKQKQTAQISLAKAS